MIKSLNRALRRAPLTALLCLLGLACIAMLFTWTQFHRVDLLYPPAQNTFAGQGKTVVVILGGGVAPDGGVPEHTQRRLDIAYKLYRDLGSSALFVPLSGGTPHKPNPVDGRGFPVWEATAAAKMLIQMGVPPQQIIEEAFSLDTIGNAYFLRAVHLEPSGLRKIMVITNTWHMPRTRAIFDFVFSLPRTTGYPYSLTGSTDAAYQLSYLPAPDGIADPRLLAARQQKEAAALVQFQSSLPHSIRSFQELHQWLFTQHNAYAAKRLLKAGENQPTDISPALLQTY